MLALFRPAMLIGNVDLPRVRSTMTQKTFICTRRLLMFLSATLSLALIFLLERTA
jgi:hypothetical protein